MQRPSGALGSIDPNKHIHIIGAGFTGLVMAYYLKKSGISHFTIHEKSSFVGGKIQTEKNQFALHENAANAIYADDNVYELLKELKLDFLNSKDKLKKKLWDGKKISSIISFLPQILLRSPFILRRPVVSEKTSVFDFFTPLLGNHLTSKLLSPAFSGIYATDIKDLHFLSIFREFQSGYSYLDFFKKKKSASKKRSISFKGGMNELINTLSTHLKDHIKLNSINDLTKLENFIICTDAKDASDLLKDKSPHISKLLRRIEYLKISTVTISTDKRIKELEDSFGIVFSPSLKDFDTLGVLANSEIFNYRVFNKDHHAYTFILKRDDIDKKDIKKELFKIGIDPGLLNSVQMTHWKRALPKYNYVRYEVINEIRNLNLNFALMGNYVDGISLREILAHARSFSKSF